MSTKLEGLEGKSVVVRRPNELRPPYNTKVIGKVGKVEFSHLSKAATRNATLAQVRFTNPGVGSTPGRKFVIPVKVANLRVVPDDYDPATGLSDAELADTDHGSSARVLWALQRQCEAYRLEAEKLRKQNTALQARIGGPDMYKIGNIVLWQGDGTDKIDTIDGRTPVLVPAKLMADLVKKARAGDESAGASSAGREETTDQPITSGGGPNEDMVTFQQMAKIIVRQFAKESDDYVTSIGNWEPDPLIPGHEQFCSLLKVPLGHWRAYSQPVEQEAVAPPGAEISDAARIERDSTVRAKNPDALSNRLQQRVAHRDGVVLSVVRPTSDPTIGTALVLFARRVRHGKDYEERLDLADLVLVNNGNRTGASE